MKRIMIVDDDFVSMELLREVLQSAGYQVDGFPSMTEIPDPWQTGTWDCVISDYYLEHHTGSELLAKIRTSGDMVPFVFLSGVSSLPGEIEPFQTGPCAFVRKPLDPNSLLSVMASFHNSALAPPLPY